MRVEDELSVADLREVASMCLCHKARNAARALTRFYDQYFAGSDVEPTQFNLLVAIGLSEPVPLIPLANVLGLERTTLTRNVEILRRNGLVSMTRGEDARQHLLSLTEEGRRALKSSLTRWKQAQAAVVAALGKKKFNQLSEALSLTNTFSNIQQQKSYEK